MYISRATCFSGAKTQKTSAVAVGFGGDADVGFEEPVEEGYIVKAQAEGDLFDLEVGDLQLALGVGDDRFGNDVSSRSVSHRFDGGA